MAGGTSYNGWPCSSDKNAINVQPFGDAYGLPFPGGVRGGDVATVLGYVATQLHNRVEQCVAGWDWGYEYRENVNNPGSMSCHASATAIDYNAPNHPNGASGTFSNDQRGTIYEILAEVQGAVQWGGDYTGTKDEMHFEIIVDAGTLAGVAATLPAGGGGGNPVPTPEPTPDETPDIARLGMYIVFGPGGARLCGPGYIKNLDGEEYDALLNVPGMAVLTVDQRGFDVHGAAMTNGQSANDIRP